jgi:hypothetical protein
MAYFITSRSSGEVPMVVSFKAETRKIPKSKEKLLLLLVDIKAMIRDEKDSMWRDRLAEAGLIINKLIFEKNG